MNTNRQQLLERTKGNGTAMYCAPDGYAEKGVFYSRQKPKYGEYLAAVTFIQPKAEYMQGHEGEPVYAWHRAPKDNGNGVLIKFYDNKDETQ